jgi:hypothetical protein
MVEFSSNLHIVLFLDAFFKMPLKIRQNRQGSSIYFFEPTMGAFLRARHAKTGLSAPIPRNCSAIPAGFPLQSLARKKSFVQNRRIAARNGTQESKCCCPAKPPLKKQCAGIPVRPPAGFPTGKTLKKYKKISLQITLPGIVYFILKTFAG